VTVVLCVALAPTISQALPGSIIVSQLLLYDNPDGCTEEPCGFYQVWYGRPLGPFGQMLGLGRHESYGDYMAPTVSQAGTQLVYAASDGTLIVAQLNAATGTASGARVLVSSTMLPDMPTSVAWSPGGRRLVLMEGFRHKGLWIVNRDGSGLRRLNCRCHIDVYGGYGVAWSDAGIAFAGEVKGRARIQVVQPDGHGLRTVTSPPKGTEDSRPAWSVDGRQLAFMRGGGGHPGGSGGVLYVVSASGGPIRLIGPGNAPVWSPHGRYLAYADPDDTDFTGTALHVTSLRTPSRRVPLPARLAGFGFVDQVTWLP
jgi:Tol biopolymer transport system component